MLGEERKHGNDTRQQFLVPHSGGHGAVGGLRHTLGLFSTRGTYRKAQGKHEITGTTLKEGRKAVQNLCNITQVRSLAILQQRAQHNWHDKTYLLSR